ncbi:molybdopterin-dependent oxidoreductase [Streptomyces sp. CRN 30]|uniref:molybdopterin-dependent oxidoreductase n=1 Tax=Streptomyces sp. CRN 30 TaxID=3075613 RepID=UPI002A7F9F7E|nr:molybdopterin-dependent oxidoreductase [Streptomyces sp. CRN 30]
MAEPTEKQGYCTLCRSRCGAVYTVEGGALTGVRPDPDHPTGAALCAKGRAAPEIVHSPDRLTRPLRRTTPKSDPDPGWEPIGWDEALTEIAGRLGGTKARHGAEAVAFAVTSPSGTPLSDSIDWIERFVRLFGSPNICYSTEICNWHKDWAHAFTFGCALPTADFAATDLAVLWGHNPAKTWLAQSAALADARTRGARVAVIDPRRSTSARDADHWLRVRPGTDAALALGTARLLLERGAYDEESVRSWTNAPLLVRADTGRFLRAEEVDAASAGGGHVVRDLRSGTWRVYDTRFPAVRPEDFALDGTYRITTVDGPVDCVPAFRRYRDACAPWTPKRTARTTGVGVAELSAFADALASARSVSYHAWTGVGQHANATQTERAIATLYALTGSFDAPGGNVVWPRQPLAPVTSVGQLAPEQRAKALGLAEHPVGPPAQGWVSGRDLCRAVLDGEPYRVRALVGFGSNLVLSQPDPRRTAEALRALDFYVHLDLFENPTARFADILLPVGSPWEHEAVKAGFEIGLRAQEHVQLRPRMVEPVGESRSDTEVVFDLARRLGLGAEFFDGDVTAGWDHRLAPLGLSVAELRRRPGGHRLPLPHAYRKFARTDEAGHVTGFATPTRRVELYSERLAAYGHSPVPEHTDPRPAADARFPLRLTCAKNGYFCHSQHRGLTSLRRRSPDPTVDISARLALARGVREGQWVELSTRSGTVRMRARIDPDLHDDVVVAEYGWWQEAPDLGLPGSDPFDGRGSNYNLLVDDDVRDPVSGSVPMRSGACEVRALPVTHWTGGKEFVVTAARPEGPDIVALTLEPADGSAPGDFRPGQHVTVSFTGPGTPAEAPPARCYSLTGPARDTARTGYGIAVRRVPGGEVSALAHTAAPGTRAWLTAPSGPFVVPTDTARPVVLLAAGIGITPFLGYLETLAVSGGSVPEVVLHHGSRDAASHAFAGRIAELRRRLPRLRVHTHYSRPGPGDRPTHRGRVGAGDVDAGLIERRARFYLCGPEEMLSEVTAGLVARGVPRFDVFAEKFHAAARAVSVPDDARATVELRRSGRRLTWTRADGTLLRLAEREGVRLPSGCRLGQCESCAVTVLDGRVTHLVDPPEDLPDDRCLTCQALPVTDVLTLDA